MPVFQSQSDLRASLHFDETVPFSTVPDTVANEADMSDSLQGEHLAFPPCQWLTTAAAFADTGGIVSGDELAELIQQRCEVSSALHLPQPVSLVARWIVSDVVVTIDSPWGRMLPLFQFDLAQGAVHACMRPLLSELRGVFDDAELALWFVTPNDWLGGASPAQTMHQDLVAVRLAARTDRYVALGG